ncbi:MAG: hypothetical protein ABIT01_15380 [Thermoanaerobaculia bacterium]
MKRARGDGERKSGTSKIAVDEADVSTAPRRHFLARTAGAWLGYGVLALLATWPLLLHLGTSCPGANEYKGNILYAETPAGLWNFWWFRTAIVDLHQSPFQTLHLFYPHGVNLWRNTSAPLLGVLGIVLQTILSLPLTFNLILLANLIASGLLARACALRLGASRSGAFLAGAVFAFSPAVLSHVYVGHLDLISTAWMPAALLLFLKLIDSPRLSRGVALGLVLVGALYTNQTYTVYALELLALTALVSWRRLRSSAHAVSLAVGAAVALVCSVPFIVNWMAAEGGGARLANPKDLDLFSGNLVDFLRPSFMNRALTPLFDALMGPSRAVPQEATVFIGFTVLGLSILALLRRATATRAVMLGGSIALFFFLLALGAHLKIGGLVTGIPLPTLLETRLPFLRDLRVPGRHAIPAMLGFGLLAGFGWDRIGSRALRFALAAALVIEFFPAPMPLMTAAVPDVYHRLASDPRSFAVLEVPFGVRDGFGIMGKPDSRQLLGQTVHGHPILAGSVSRTTKELWQALAEPPVLYTLLQPNGPIRDWEANVARDKRDGPAWFLKNQVLAIVIHPEARNGPEEGYLQSVLPIGKRESFPDGTLLLWLADGK